MITPDKKDALLIKMVNDPNREWLGVDPEYSGFTLPLLSAVIRQFSERRLVKLIGSLGKGDDTYTLAVEANSDDFLRRGGFMFEEVQFRNQFSKLELELATLEGEIPQERFKNIMTLVSAASAAVSAYAAIK